MTATIMDSFDAQMLDYQNDLDVQMHISSSDPWFQDVAPMEDDAHLTFQPKVGNTDTSPTIEVDMETYVDDEHIEYEMLDDHHSHNPASGELLDVDVLPASTVQSPLVTVTALPITPSVEYPQLTTQLASNSHSTSLPLISGQSAESSTAIDPTLENSSTILAPQAADTPLPGAEQPSDPVVTTEPVGSHDNDNTEQPMVPAIPPPIQVPTEHPNISQPSSSRGQSVADGAPEAEGTVTHDSNVFVETEGEGDSRHLDSGQQPTHPESSNASMPAHDDPAGSQALVEQAGEHPPPHILSQGFHVDNTEPAIEQDPLAKVAPPEAPEELSTDAAEHKLRDKDVLIAHSMDESAGVLNEASEEVYLEAPPPILLAIFSVDDPELCLFNKPLELLPNEDDAQERHILLQTAPSLYYEPLVHTFEALRQDEYISTVLEVTGNELALEAHELDLAITEDNFYSREISLHDIHVLHASANLAGPLRLRLYIAGSRFIVRYHILQEGLLSLHVDGSQDSGHDDTDQSQLDEQEGETIYAQNDISGTEGALLTGETHLNASEETGGQLVEEEVEHTEEYYEPSHTEAEEAATQSGEIDLSTLPPFVDSPEAREDDQEQDEDSTEIAYPVVAASHNATAGNSHTQGEERDSDQLVYRDELDFEEPSSIQKGSAENEEGPPHSQLYCNKETGADIETKDGEGPETGPNTAEEDENEEHNQTLAQEHVEKTPQSEQIESTHEEESLLLEPTDENQHTNFKEDTSNDQYENVQLGATAIEDIKDFEGELDQTWDDELDGEGDPDTTWEAGQENVDESISNESSVTLSSKASKRSFDESGLEYSDDENFVSESPGAKRARVD